MIDTSCSAQYYASFCSVFFFFVYALILYSLFSSSDPTLFIQHFSWPFVWLAVNMLQCSTACFISIIFSTLPIFLSPFLCFILFFLCLLCIFISITKHVCCSYICSFLLHVVGCLSMSFIFSYIALHAGMNP